MSFVTDANGHSVNIDDSRAVYRILAIHGFYGPDDHLYTEGSLIYFDGEPNEEMEALTQVAHERLVAHVEKLDKYGKEAAEKTGRPFIGRPRSLDGQLALASAVQRADMSIMGSKKTETSVEAINSDGVPEVGTANPKRKAGRPKTSLSVSAA